MESDLDELYRDSDNNSDDEEEVLDAIDEHLSETEEEAPIQRHRKILTRKRKVNSIDAALDIENYDNLIYLNCAGEWEDLTGFLGPKKEKNTKTITWTNEGPSLVGRQRACDVITSPVSCLREGIVINYEVDAFDLQVDAEMILHVVERAITHITKIEEKIGASDAFKNSPEKYTYLGETDPLKVRAYFGISYARGLLGQNLHRVDDLFTDHSHFAFGGTMSKNRYKYLHANINFSTSDETRNA